MYRVEGKMYTSTWASQPEWKTVAGLETLELAAAHAEMKAMYNHYPHAELRVVEN